MEALDVVKKGERGKKKKKKNGREKPSRIVAGTGSCIKINRLLHRVSAEGER